jgi:pyruvate dehydrogenase E1 component alpha subunit
MSATTLDGGLRTALLRQMLRIRLVEEGLAQRYPEQQMRCPVHLSIGQEAVAAGVCAALAPRDYLLSTHRAHAHYLAKGGGLKAMLAEIYGKAAGCTSGRGGSMHLVDLSVNMLGSTPIVGGTLPVAVGAAFGAWLKGEDRATVIFFGEGSTEEGVFAECLNFAALKKLPIIFVCENNLYSVYSPLSVRQPRERDRAALVRAHGIEASVGDGNDVEEVYRTASAAVERVRKAQGPAYLEFDTYRWREHCGPNYDNDIGYRTEAEFQSWRKRCPIEKQSARLLGEGLIGEPALTEMKREIGAEIEEAFAFAKAAPFPAPESLLEGVYAAGKAA